MQNFAFGGIGSRAPLHVCVYKESMNIHVYYISKHGKCLGVYQTSMKNNDRKFLSNENAGNNLIIH